MDTYQVRAPLSQIVHVKREDIRGTLCGKTSGGMKVQRALYAPSIECHTCKRLAH